MIQYLPKALQGVIIALDWQNNMIVQVVLFKYSLLIICLNFHVYGWALGKIVNRLSWMSKTLLEAQMGEYGWSCFNMHN
jgi:hypothetical protein